MAMLSTNEITPTKEEERLGEQVEAAMGGFISNRIIRWNPENRKSETQIKEMIMMCNKSTLMAMFENRRVEFIPRILEFTNKVKGRAGQKIKNLMTCREYAKMLMKKNTKKAKTEAKESEWPDMDPKRAKEIKKYIKTATFSEIMGSKQHRRNTEQLTYQTTSKG